MEYVIVGMMVVLAAAAVAYSLYKSAVGKGGCAGCPRGRQCQPGAGDDRTGPDGCGDGSEER